MIREFEYTMETTRLLSLFQTLEFSLKIYIATSYHIVRHKLAGTIPFGYSYKTIKDFPLERLLTVFSQLNSNTELQRRLNKLRKHRNYVAHQALILRHEAIRDVLGEDFERNRADIASTFAELDQCLLEVNRELEAVFKVHASLAEA